MCNHRSNLNVLLLIYFVQAVNSRRVAMKEDLHSKEDVLRPDSAWSMDSPR